MKVSLFLSGMLAAGSAFGDDYCEFRKALDFDLSAQDLSGLELVARAGGLSISGDAQVNEVLVAATACASSQNLLDDMAVTQEVSGGTLRLETNIPKPGWSLGGNSYASIELDIVIPARFDVAVEDGSGSTEISGVNNLTVEDGSGHLIISAIQGDVAVEDGSGKLDIRNTVGSVVVTDGSGGIEIDDVQGEVLVDEDGSGSIQISNVRNNVMIGDDGSGEITIRDINGDVMIEEDSSGSIKVSNVTGNFRVDRDGNGGITHRNVAGNVSVPEKSQKKRY